MKLLIRIEGDYAKSVIAIVSTPVNKNIILNQEFATFTEALDAVQQLIEDFEDEDE